MEAMLAGENRKKNTSARTPWAGRLVRQMRQAVARAPGGHYVLDQARAVEDVLFEDLQLRLGGMDSRYYLPGPAGTSSAEGDGPDRSLQSRFAALADQSLEQTPDSAMNRVYGRIVNQLLPDEVRILTAMSDGSDIAISHLLARGGRFKSSEHRVMAFLSRVGNESGVMLAEAVPHYLAHLFSLGLLDGGPEDTTQTAKYEAIENGSEVRAACEMMRKESRLRPVFIRETAHLSAFGKAFWTACSG